MKIIENYEKKQWTIEYSPFKLKIIPPQDISISLTGLSDEIIYMIFEYLNISDVKELSKASKDLYKFSVHYLYEHPVISSLASLSQYLQQYERVRQVQPIALPVFIQSLTLTMGFYHEIIRNLGQSNYCQQLFSLLQELFRLSYLTISSLSLNFQIDNNNFYSFFMPIIQNYTFSKLTVLRLRNPTKETLNYLLLRMPHLQYLSQDNYTNPFYVSVKEIFSLDSLCQYNIRNFYYTIGDPLDTRFNLYLKSQNLGLWKIILKNENAFDTEININEKNQMLTQFMRIYPNALSVNLNRNMNNNTLLALTSCRQLIELHLHYGNFTSIGLCNLFSGFTSSFDQLSYLSLDSCQGVNDDVVQAITQNCPKLVTFSVNQCRWVTDCSMKFICEQLTQLKRLEVSGTRLTSVGLWNLTGMARLSHLNLTQCYHLSLEGLIEFIKTTTSLFFSVSSLNQQEKHKNGCIGMDDSLFYDISEDLTMYASTEIDKLKELQNNYKMHQMQNDISSLDITSKKKKYRQRSISNIFLQYCKH
ncbi:RNI-like protein [Piromyces finnis]|uniref:RNI-like protein n=1 Tax=Piromyces finnis TaxID=1754191 RepID=A0A1Y1VK59_9FUNG|nr:RNI-like protein [Piromyces finnis]|eukprot:ORX58471.1 RNI-like protein [Piromyces finnis]